jgi:glycosyltransferase involved in cell wall biosynthesis
MENDRIRKPGSSDIPRACRTAKPTHVLLVSATDGLGGAERSLLDLVQAIDSTKWHLLALTPGQGPLTRRLRESGVEVFDCDALGRLQRDYRPRSLLDLVLRLRHCSRRIEQIAVDRQVDIIHANTTTAAIFATMARARQRHVPVVWHVRDLRTGPELRWLARSVRGIVCVSRACRQSLPPLRSNTWVEVINSGVRIESGATHRRPPPERPVIAAVGHFAPWKGHELLLQALALVRGRGINATLEIAGGDPFGDLDDTRRAVQHAARATHLGGVVKFHGILDDVRPLLRRATCLVHTAYPEPFGRAIVEALSCECPVIALGGHHGPAEILGDGVGGLLIEPRTPEGVARAICDVIEDPGLARALSAGALTKAQSLYDRRKMAMSMESFYGRVLTGTPPTPEPG